MLPILPSVIIFGIIFGITGFTSDLPLYLVSSMSYIIFAGSSQFLVLILISENDPIIAILVAGILINLRHIFYGAALNKEFQGMGKKKILTGYLLTGEAYLIPTFTKKSDRAPYDLKIIDVIISGGGLL